MIIVNILIILLGLDLQTMEGLMNKIEKLNKMYTQKLTNNLPSKQLPKFILNGSGCRQKSNLMQLPTFRIAVCICLFSIQQQEQFSIMVTASHNSAAYNGIKIGYTNGDMLNQKKLQTIQNCINSNQQFQNFINQYEKYISQKNVSQINCYVGRDCRTSSPYLSQIIIKTLKQFQMNFIDVGICTTPQLYSFSKYLSLRLKKQRKESIKIQLNIQKIKQNYVDQVIQSFGTIYKKIKRSEKFNVLLDFSNGSGAVSYLKYKKQLSEFFNIKQTFNTDFDHPNHKCGAHYFYENWIKIIQGKQYDNYNQCFFFDGDSDRIIAKIQNFDLIFDGNYFMVYFLKFLQQIIKNLKEKKLINQKDQLYFKLHAIGTVVMNLGTKRAVQDLQINFYSTDVGIINLHNQIKKKVGISVFFQPNGHGGIYYSQESYLAIENLFRINKDNIQLQILLTLYKILQNNSKGYGLHNMLTYYIIKAYLDLPNISQLLKLTHEHSKNMYIVQKFDTLIKNDPQKQRELIEPIEVRKYIAQITSNLKYEKYQIIVRKSATEKCLVRVFAQGISFQICQQIIHLIQNKFKQLNYLVKNQFLLSKQSQH